MVIGPLVSQFWAAWFLVALIRRVVVFEHQRHEGKLIQDLLLALIYLAAGFAVIAYDANSARRRTSAVTR
jgi:hypothetical protein